VAAHQRTHAGAVDVCDASQIDDEMTAATAEEIVDAPLVGFRGATGDERFLRRNHDLTPRRAISHGRSSMRSGMLARPISRSTVGVRAR
jgi:hypothetical protein